MEDFKPVSTFEEVMVIWKGHRIMNGRFVFNLDFLKCLLIEHGVYNEYSDDRIYDGRAYYEFVYDSMYELIKYINICLSSEYILSMDLIDIFHSEFQFKWFGGDQVHRYKVLPDHFADLVDLVDSREDGLKNLSEVMDIINRAYPSLYSTANCLFVRMLINYYLVFNNMPPIIVRNINDTMFMIGDIKQEVIDSYNKYPEIYMQTLYKVTRLNKLW